MTPKPKCPAAVALGRMNAGIKRNYTKAQRKRFAATMRANQMKRWKKETV